MNIEDMSNYEDVLKTYNTTLSLKETGKMHGIGIQKVRKILLTLEAYEDDRSREIAKMVENGMEVQEIADKLRISAKAVNSYMPYSRGVYKSDNPTKNAKIIREWREKKEL